MKREDLTEAQYQEYVGRIREGIQQYRKATGWWPDLLLVGKDFLAKDEKFMTPELKELTLLVDENAWPNSIMFATRVCVDSLRYSIVPSHQVVRVLAQDTSGASAPRLLRHIADRMELEGNRHESGCWMDGTWMSWEVAQ